jgi:nucleoside-diphosphate-sugar epimerase
MHEINVIGTMNLLAAAGAAGSSVRHIVVKSSTLVYGSAASDPNTFLEDTPRTSPVRNSVERALVEADGLMRDFAEDNPGTRVTVLRFANVLGEHLTTPISRNLARSVCPSIFGFDPLLQFIEEGDVVRALLHVTQAGIPGLFNVAAEGRLPWSEVATIAGTRLVPLSPFSPLKIRPPVRPAGGARGSAALRPGRRYQALCRHRVQVQRHQRRRRAVIHPSLAPPPANRQAGYVLHLRARRGAVLPSLTLRGGWHRRLTIRSPASPGPTRVRARPIPPP